MGYVGVPEDLTHVQSRSVVYKCPRQPTGTSSSISSVLRTCRGFVALKESINDIGNRGSWADIEPVRARYSSDVFGLSVAFSLNHKVVALALFLLNCAQLLQTIQSDTSSLKCIVSVMQLTLEIAHYHS